MATITTNVAAVQFGTCQVKYGTLDLGLIKGGVTFTYERDYYDIMSDSLTMVIRSELVAERAMAVVNIQEITVAKLNSYIPGSTLFTDATTPANQRTEVGGGTISDSDYQVLTIIPVTDGAATISTDVNAPIIIHRALAMPQVTLEFNRESERTFPIEFKGYNSEVTTAGVTTRRLVSFGDLTAAP